MTDRTQPDSASTKGAAHIIRYALELGLLWIDGDGRDKVREALDELDTLEAQLEAQLAQRFTAADMATASAQGFRDGVASIAANAEGPVVNRATVIEWLDANDIEVTDRQLGGLFHFSAPPTAQAEGWRPIETAPKDGTYLLLWEQYSTNPFVGCWAFGVWAVSHEHVDAEGGWDGANVVDSISQERITHWMPLPNPPTSAEGVDHGPQ